MARILVVEDNVANRILARELLVAHGHEVLDAHAGREGVESARRDQPDLILLDLQLPDIDGYAVVRELRADASTAGIPVVALTAFALEGDRERAIASGCDGYVTKPIRYKELLESIREVLFVRGSR